VELTGLEPAAPSLRKMRSKLSDQEKRPALGVVWRGCGPSDVRRREMWRCDTLISFMGG
jgi:hypothetical protein